MLVNLKKLIEGFGDNFVRVFLFGSQASGNAHEFSDYDILIILKNEYDLNYKNRILNLYADFQIDNEVYLDMIIINQNEINHSIRQNNQLFKIL